MTSAYTYSPVRTGAGCFVRCIDGPSNSITWNRYVRAKRKCESCLAPDTNRVDFLAARPRFVFALHGLSLLALWTPIPGKIPPLYRNARLLSPSQLTPKPFAAFLAAAKSLYTLHRTVYRLQVKFRSNPQRFSSTAQVPAVKCEVQRCLACWKSARRKRGGARARPRVDRR